WAASPAPLHAASTPASRAMPPMRARVRATSFCTSGPLLERAAAAHAETGEQLRRRAEAGKAGLQQVQADEGGDQVEPGRNEISQGEAGEDHHAGEGEDGAVEVHGGSPVISARPGAGGSVESNLELSNIRVN